MNTARYPVIITNIGDMSIRSVLDNAFFGDSEMAPISHAHASYEVLIAIGGEFCIDVHNKAVKDTVILTTGSAYLIPPGVYHCTHGAIGEQRKLAIRFNCTKIKGEETKASVLKRVSDVLSRCDAPMKLENADRLCEIVKEIRKEISSEEIASEEYVHILLNQFFVNLFRISDVGSEKHGKHVPKLAQSYRDDRRLAIEEFLYTRFAEPLTEEDLAEEMNISKRQLSRIIREYFGTSFRRLLIDVRLNRAAQLLIEKDASVEDIAALVGYTSLSGFYSAFKDRFSISAGQYRRSFK